MSQSKGGPRNSSYSGKMETRIGIPRPSQNQMQDRVEVRIRGKNNHMQKHTGSISQTMEEMGEERKRKQELVKAANRLKMLEKLEEFRENKMMSEIAQLEAERRAEEEELKKARDKERKYAKYLERQKSKLVEYAIEKQEKQTKV